MKGPRMPVHSTSSEDICQNYKYPMKKAAERSKGWGVWGGVTPHSWAHSCKPVEKILTKVLFEILHELTKVMMQAWGSRMLCGCVNNSLQLSGLLTELLKSHFLCFLEGHQGGSQEQPRPGFMTSGKSHHREKLCCHRDTSLPSCHSTQQKPAS